LTNIAYQLIMKQLLSYSMHRTISLSL